MFPNRLTLRGTGAAMRAVSVAPITYSTRCGMRSVAHRGPGLNHSHVIRGDRRQIPAECGVCQSPGNYDNDD
jgi:hypothetical protein